VDIGESKTYVARAYALNKINKKIYGAYSNEVKVDNSKVETPTLTIGAGADGIAKTVIFSIALDGYYVTEEALNTISGWELYEKVGDKYNLVDGYQVTVDIGESKTYVARAYALNKINKKIYGAYSNEVTIYNILYGDVNDDGVVDIADTMTIQSYIEGSKELTETQKLAADVNLDNKIDNNDVAIIRNYLAHIIDKLPYTQ